MVGPEREYIKSSELCPVISGKQIRTPTRCHEFRGHLAEYQKEEVNYVDGPSIIPLFFVFSQTKRSISTSAPPSIIARKSFFPQRPIY